MPSSVFAGILSIACVFTAEAASGASPPSIVSLDGVKPVRVLNLKGTTYHVQGIDTDGKRLWVTSVDTRNRKGYLYEFSVTTGESLRSIEIQDNERFHPGGVAAEGNSLWFPVAEYRANSTSIIERRNKRTLRLEFQFSVPDHIGCIAVTPELLIGGNWDSRDFYIWNHRGELVRKVASSTGNAYQDLKFRSDYVVASGLLADHSGAIDWLEPASLQLVHRLRVGSTDRGASYTREGMTIYRDRLFVLPEDGPSRLFVFRLSP
jgi:hypothetical protein